MTRNVVEIINSKIKELQTNLLLLKKVSQEVNEENIKEDMIKYWGIERGIQISIECVIDIVNIIISSLALDKHSRIHLFSIKDVSHGELLQLKSLLRILVKFWNYRVSSLPCC